MDLTSILALASMAVGTVTDIAKTSADNDAAKAAAERRAKELALEKNKEERKAKNLLKEQLAKQRAAFAAMGLDPDEGSSLAVLNRIQDDSAEDLKYLREGYLHKLDRAADSASATQRKSLLSSADSLTSGTSRFASELNKS